MPDDLQQQMARSLGSRRAFGKYRGFVVDNADPDKLARVKLRVPSLLGNAESGWALPCLPCGGMPNQGFFAVPAIGAQVWVEFEGGILDFPIWSGTFWQQPGDAPEEAQNPPTSQALRTAKGHVLVLEDKDDGELIRLLHSTGARLEMDKDGNVLLTSSNQDQLVLDAQKSSIRLEDANGGVLSLDRQGIKLEDASGNIVETTASGVKISTRGMIAVDGGQVFLGGSGGEPIIKGASFLALFATHVHPTSSGPSGPPVPQGEMNSLSSKVMTA